MLVTPSHQYPLGMVMSLARRQMLLEFARQNGCWIIEDDYDSEFRYGSRPLASLQGLDTAGQVIYVGSFGKTLFPGLRIGYIVVPEGLSTSFAGFRRVVSRGAVVAAGGAGRVHRGGAFHVAYPADAGNLWAASPDLAGHDQEAVWRCVADCRRRCRVASRAASARD